MLTKPKPKLGRPTREDSVSSESVTLRLTKDESALLDLYSWRYEMSKSDAIRFALDIVGVF